MITFPCSSCGQSLRAIEQQAGKQACCPHCSQLTTIPAATVEFAAATLPSAAHLATDPTTTVTLPPGPPPPAADAPMPNTALFVPETISAAMGSTPAGIVTIPGFEILGELGRGGMGVVYRARQLQPRRLVALKMILAGAHTGAEQLARFHAEAAATARLQHPNFVQVHEVGEHAGLPFLTLEFVEGGNLAQHLKKESLTSNQAAELVRQLARAAHHAHGQGIVHRDLKPANILLASAVEDNGRLPWLPKIADFGLAKQLEGMASVAGTGPRTQSGAILGTPQYMAPEQVKGKSKEISPAVDVYALGAILYECLTGKPPFTGGETLEILMKVATEEPPPPRRLKPGTPRDLETICLKCLHKDPARRYASAAALAGDLSRFLAGESIQARRQGTLERASRWVNRHPELVYLIGGAATILFLCAIILVVWNPFHGVVPLLTQAEDENAKRTALPPDLQMVPRDVFGFLSVRVADVWAMQNPLDLAEKAEPTGMKGMLDLQSLLKQVEKELSLKPQDVERFTFVLPSLDPFLKPNDDNADGPILILSFTRPYDWAKVKKYGTRFQQYQEKTRDKWSIYEPVQKGAGLALFSKSERILLLGQSAALAKFLTRAETAANEGPLQESLELAAKNYQYVLGVTPPRNELDDLMKNAKDLVPPELLELQVASLRMNLLPPAAPGQIFSGIDAELRLTFPDAAAATAGTKAAGDLLRKMFDLFDKSPFAQQTPALVKKVLLPLRQPDWKQEDKIVRLALKVQWQPNEIEALLAEVNGLAARAESLHKLKQMGLAMHNYNEAFKSLPPASSKDPKTGKPLLSWRVALLPWLEQGALHKQFKLDRPWDDPANLALLEKMPDIFKAPRPKGWVAKPEDKTHTHYQVFVGPNTAFDPDQKVSIGKIAVQDGTSYTILVVEALQPVPWTKPEDIPFDAQPLLPRVGGLFPDGFHAVMADGRPLFFPKTISEPKILRPAITFNDGILFELP